jgi:hypothetical protein
MPTVDTILQCTKGIEALVKFVESGELATKIIADVEFKAAQASLIKSKLANDPKSQVWNAISQLETSYQAHVRTIESYQWWHTGFAARFLDLDVAMRKARYTLCVMSICYAYLEEQELCRQHLSQARSLMCDYREKFAPEGWDLAKAKLAGHIGTLARGFGTISMFEIVSARVLGKLDFPEITTAQINELEHNLLHHHGNSTFSIFYCEGKKKE